MNTDKEALKKDLALILKLDAEMDYTRKNLVKKYHDAITQKGLLATPYGQKYLKRLEQLLAGDNACGKCVFCNAENSGVSMICPACMAKVRKTPAVRRCERCGNQLAESDGSCPVCQNAKMRVADRLKGITGSGMEKLQAGQKVTKAFEKLQANMEAIKAFEKLQAGPAAAKAMAKGKEQMGKAQGKWRSLSRKKQIVIAAVCVLFLLLGIGGVNAISGAGGGLGGAGGSSGGGEVKSLEAATNLVIELYPEEKGFRILTGTEHQRSAASDQLLYFFMQIGETDDDPYVLVNARKRLKENAAKNAKGFTYYIIPCIRYDNNTPLYDMFIWIGEDGRVIEQISEGSTTRVR